MGGAIIEAVCRAVNPKDVFIYDRDTSKTAELSEKTGCAVAESADTAVRNAHFIFLCVKPHLLNPVLSELSATLKAEAEKGQTKVIVSIAAGVTKSSIELILSEKNLELPVVRLMPNTPVFVGKGLILMSASKSVSEEDSALLSAALAPGGKIAAMDESYFDAATPVFSCSPAYVYMFIEALADGGVMAGVPRDKAQSFAAQAVLGAAAMVLETGKHPGELKDAVCSPGGSTIVGVEELEKGGFRAAVASAVYEAYKKTTMLGK